MATVKEQLPLVCRAHPVFNVAAVRHFVGDFSPMGNHEKPHEPIIIRKDRRKKILLNTNRTFRPHGLPQQNREQSGEGRSYIPVPRQRDIGAPVPGTVKQVRGGGGRRSEGIGLTHAHGEGGGVRGYIPVPRHRCTGAKYGKTSKRGSRRNEEIGLTHAQGEYEKCRS